MKQFQDTETWAKKQWQTSQFGDARRNIRAISLAKSLLNRPNGSLPCQTENWANLKGAYRLLNSNQVSHSKLQKIHWKNTLEEATRSEKTILLIQDTSELDYSSKKKTKDLGAIGNHVGRGIMIHTCLAVEFDIKPERILGLANQQTWIRNTDSLQKIETIKQRHSRDNEGLLWKKALIEISTIIQSSAKFVSVGDRGNDIFDFMKFCKEGNWNYLVRAKHNRVIMKNDQKHKLFDYVKTFEVKAKKIIILKNSNEKKEIELNIGWEQIKIFSAKSHSKKSEYKEISIWCLRCWNTDNNIEWILLTNLSINNQIDALEKVAWYSSRWLIEEYHKCLKTGCAIEKRNLQSAHGLKSLLGFLGVIATKLLEIKFMAKLNPSLLAINFADAIPLKIICSRFSFSETTITTQEFWHGIARLGGFIGRKSDGDPGWQTLWNGWLRLTDMISGAESIKKCG